MPHSAPSSDSVRALIEAIIKALVDQPQTVRVREIRGANHSIIEVRVAPRDVGKVIGKKGMYADAIRHLAHAAGSRLGRNYTLELVE